MTYNNYFKEIHSTLKEISDDTYHYINNILYCDVKLPQQLSLGDMSFEIVEKLIKLLDINTITLMIDRFDRNNKSEFSQNILSKYFGMFNKTIITTDDIDLIEKGNRDILIDNGYSFIDVNYGTDSYVVKEILRKRLVSYNENIDLRRKERIPLDVITDDVYKYLADNCNGDIKVMISVLREIISNYWWYSGNYNIELDINNLCGEQLQKVKALNKMNASYPPHLYLVKK